VIGSMWIRRSTYEKMQDEIRELRRQYGARVALERSNLRDLENRYNGLLEEYRELESSVMITRDSAVRFRSGA